MLQSVRMRDTINVSYYISRLWSEKVLPRQTQVWREKYFKTVLYKKVLLNILLAPHVKGPCVHLEIMINILTYF